MISAILPIHITENPFWSSLTGLDLIKQFFDKVNAVERINEWIILTSDNSILQIAGEYDRAITIHIDNLRVQDRSYTFEECMLFAKKCVSSSKKKNNRFMVLDHRNLSLAIDDLKDAIFIHEQSPNCCVLSLSSLRDHPCQFRTFFSFLGCGILHFGVSNLNEKSCSDNFQLCYHKYILCRLRDNKKIKFGVSIENSIWSLTISGDIKNSENLVSHIIPFDSGGLLYESAYEILIPPHEHQIQLDVRLENINGIMIFIVASSRSGAYDTVELFESAESTWKWSGNGYEVINSKTKEPILGRQQFPEAYTFDGSICLLKLINRTEEFPTHFLPVNIENSCIVTDWVDYYCAFVG